MAKKKVEQKKKKTAGKKRSLSKSAKSPIKMRPRMLIVGLVMTLIGMLFLFSLISPDGTLTSWLNNLLARWFGVGRYLFPLLMASIGVYYLLTGMEKQPKLPRQQILGGLIIFIAVESMASIWVVMRSFPDYWAISGAGRGGGFFGSVFGRTVALLIGDLGSFITYGLLASVGLFLFFALDPLMLLDKVGEFLQLKPKLEPAVATSPLQPSGIDLIAPNPEGSKRFQDREFQRPNEETSDVEPAPPAPRKKGERDKAATVRAQEQKKKKRIFPRKSDPEPESVETNFPSRLWTVPTVSAILKSGYNPESNDEEIQEHKKILVETLASFGAPCELVDDVQQGPMVTQYGIKPGYVHQRNGKKTKVKVSKIVGLADDLALALAAKSVRIQAPVPGKGYIGIEIPSSSKVVVSLRDVMESAGFARIKSRLRIGLGQDVAGNAISANLAKMPHLLIAGATGSGKSVCVNAIITCLLLQNSPDELRFVMVDPKRVELTGYNGIPHLATPVVVEMDKVVGVLMWALREMDGRYQKFAKVGARNIDTYNKKMEKTGGEKLPHIVIIIDELADLMMTAPEDTERALARLAQMARATGMHMIVATQRPSVDVVTGLIKANFPARIAFAVSSSTDSRVILDQVGAERLLGQGDMLFQKPDAPSPMRMQGCYVSDEELNNLIKWWKDARRTQVYGAADIEPKPIEIKPAAIVTPPKAPTEERPPVVQKVEKVEPEKPKRKPKPKAKKVEPKPEKNPFVRPEPDPSDPPIARPDLIPPEKKPPTKKPPVPTKPKAKEVQRPRPVQKPVEKPTPKSPAPPPQPRQKSKPAKPPVKQIVEEKPKPKVELKPLPLPKPRRVRQPIPPVRETMVERPVATPIAPIVRKPVTSKPKPVAQTVKPQTVKPLLDVDEEKRLTEQDELWEDALAFVRKTGKASTSMLQRKFRIGYTRAARMIDMMEEEEIIGQPTGTSRAREVLK